MTTKWRALTSAQIGKLTVQGCTCPDWSKVLAVDGFDPERVKNTHFSGDVRLGLYQKNVGFGRMPRPAGISNATIHNCVIGDNVYIRNVKGAIANYTIENDVLIENIDHLVVDSQSTTSFGNGINVAVINEAGGREIPIFDKLSAQLAYIIALYRHRPKLIEKLREMIGLYADSVKSSMGFVGAGVKIVNSGTIRNVKVGPAAIIESVTYLQNGSINSCPEDPIYIGPAVLARNFIICSGSKVTDGAQLTNCFVGQGVELARQFSAENCAFFANCACLQGEACSIFAGPYTVTHHKSTLLIAGFFSFFNAGSGTNLSNHLYKLGPVHQGIVERGSKTASASYMVWPARVGAFSVVLGRHYRNFDTSDLPFSYIIEHEGQSVLVPAVNLRSVGAVRDAQKWPQRDKRKDPKKLDLLNFELLNPYTVQKMLNGCNLLRNLKATGIETAGFYDYNGVKIKHDSLDKGIRLYEIGIDLFLGDCLTGRLEGKHLDDSRQLQALLKPDSETGAGKWLDLAGMLAPEQAVTKILDDIESGSLANLDRIAEAFACAHQNYPQYEWAWAANILQQRIGKTIDAIGPDDVIEMINKWKSALTELDNMLLADAQKEFSPASQIGYGTDGDPSDRAADFAQVRGTFENNDFVIQIRRHTEEKIRLAEDTVRLIQKLPK